jgi:hypothetical protein
MKKAKDLHHEAMRLADEAAAATTGCPCFITILTRTFPAILR